MALKRQRILGRGICVHAKPSAVGVPGIFATLAGLIGGGTLIESTAEYSVGKGCSDLPAVSGSTKSLIRGTAACGHQSALQIGGLFGGDVDDPIYSVRPPDGRTRPANDFDARDGFEQQGLSIPIASGEDGRVDGAAVDQN